MTQNIYIIIYIAAPVH